MADLRTKRRELTRRLVIAVRGHGKGLPANELERVFERSYRGVTGQAVPFGSGMGLSIARGLLAIEGGPSVEGTSQELRESGVVVYS